MKNLIKHGSIRHVFMLILLTLTQAVVWAQDGASTSSSTTQTTTTTTETTQDWYTQPWVWIVGGAVFILILIALLRGNSSSNTEVSRTTVIKDREI